MIPEKDIITGCVRGDRYYQKLLYKTYASKMFGVCLRYFKKKADAEDCLQEGFIKVFNYIDTYKGVGSFEGWIRKIMVNTAINSFKSNQKFNDQKELDEIDNFFPVHNETDNFSAEYLNSLIHNLPEGYRIVFNLYAIEGYSHKEISSILNISEGTSKSQLSRARAILQQKLVKKNENVSSEILKNEQQN